MTLNKTSWLKGKVLRLYLSGYTQEAIAKELNISVGTTNTIVNEPISSDDTINLQRQIAIVSKANGISIKQIAANLRWKNQIKLSSLDEKNFEKFLDAMETLFNKNDVKPITAANQFFSIIETMLRNKIEPHRLEEEIELKQDELQRVKAEIEANEKILEESNSNLDREQASLRIRKNELEQFRELSQLLPLYDIEEFSGEIFSLVRAIKDFKDLNYDPKDIISKYENMLSLKRTNEKLQAKLRRSEEILESYIRKQRKAEIKWKDKEKAFGIFTNLINAGLKQEDIFNITCILHKDFSEDTISELIKDISTYGSISAATWRLVRQHEAQIEPIY
jgi:hypothetical protein